MKYDNIFEVFGDYILKTLSYYLDYPLVTPERVNIATTFQCPLNCEMCSIPQKDRGKGEELSVDEWKDIINQISRWGVKHVSFSGGETLVRKEKTLKLMEYANKKGLEIDLITNGYYMDEKTTRRILGTGVDRISLSIDGSKKKIHDSIRGGGSFEKIKEAIGNMNDYREIHGDVEYEFTTVVMKKNYEDLVNIYGLMKESNFDFLNFQALIPDNSFETSQDYNDDLWLDDKDSEKLKEISSGLIRIKSETGDIRNSKKYLRLMPEYFKKRENFRYGKCMAGYEVIHIDPYGNIDLCGFEPSVNVKGKNLKEVWKGEKYKELRKKVKKCERPCLLLCYRKLDLEDIFKTHVEASIADE